ncbi:hypothetical protein QJS04_geneDACA015428 [Acorus gramineus]|uniref:DUF4408 domain-containing protein n=1 Tax=Acorus gramineus TaxID=55184 RepID=A0AAV9A4P7_ACOGR|nr:hypothetical protein QJS04_geneDACA015428 [Acorus gramineus]
MDPIHREKLQAMKRYKKHHKDHQNLLKTLITHTIVAVLLGVFLSSPLWIPKLLSSIDLLIKNIGAFVFRPGCLFVLCNAIIIFLVRDSRRGGPPDIYDEYLEHNKGLKRVYLTTITTTTTNNNNNEVVEVEEEREVEKHVVEEKIEEIEEEEEEEEEEVHEEEDMEGEEEVVMGMSTEELNRKVEEFIARVNMQRRREDQLLLCSG